MTQENDPWVEEFHRGLERSAIPDYMQGAVERWVLRGIPPGDFLSAFLANDLKETFARADSTNLGCIQAYVKFFYDYCPMGCWGSPEAIRAWKGLGKSQRSESND